MSLVGELYRLSKDNQAFLHARLQMGDDPLTPYKDTIARWVYPDLFKNQDVSVAKAKKAISDYRKAVGDKTGLLELMTLYCEEAAAFATDIALDDEGFYDALVRMFEEALKTIREVPPGQRERFFNRLKHVGRDLLADWLCELVMIWSSSWTATFADKVTFSLASRCSGRDAQDPARQSDRPTQAMFADLGWHFGIGSLRRLELLRFGWPLLTRMLWGLMRGFQRRL